MRVNIAAKLALVYFACVIGTMMSTAEPQSKPVTASDIEELGESRDSLLHSEYFLLKHRNGGAKAIKVVLRNTSADQTIMIRWRRGVMNALLVILDSRGKVLYNPVTDWERNSSIPKVPEFSLLKPKHEITNVISLPKSVFQNLREPCVGIVSVNLEGEIVATGAGCDLKPDSPKAWRSIEEFRATRVLLKSESPP